MREPDARRVPKDTYNRPVRPAQRSCPAYADERRRCRCEPSYRARRRIEGRPRWSPVFKDRASAVSWDGQEAKAERTMESSAAKGRPSAGRRGMVGARRCGYLRPPTRAQQEAIRDHDRRLSADLFRRKHTGADATSMINALSERSGPFRAPSSMMPSGSPNRWTCSPWRVVFADCHVPRGRPPCLRVRAPSQPKGRAWGPHTRVGDASEGRQVPRAGGD